MTTLRIVLTIHHFLDRATGAPGFTLALAEEYRRRGHLAEALEVLQVGLSHHPGYLAAQVSLGRCWL